MTELKISNNIIASTTQKNKKTEAKTKVVAAVQFHVVLQIYHQNDFKKLITVIEK